MTYSKRFGNYGIYTGGFLFKWFKDEENARKVWDERFAKPACREDWLEDYGEIKLVNMRTGETLEIYSED